ncbi:MAG: amidase [Ilumatobacteraceae bacterium]
MADPAFTSLTSLDATAQAELVRRHEVSPAELVVAAIAVAERLNPTINAIIHPRYERALEDAHAGVGSGPFAGVPVVIKDLGVMQAGEPYHGGTRALKRLDHRADHDSAVVRRLCDAGFIPIGRTNTPEWGSTITTEPLAHGPSRNPWNTDHSTGGSSGGSAAAVAAEIAPVGHAGDGGGSIRIPASECALVGLKPSRGRVSNAPEAGEAWAGYATNGAVTRTVRDAAAVLDVLSGYEPGDPYVAPALPRPLAAEVGADPGRLRIGFTATVGGDVGTAGSVGPVDDECVAAVDVAAKLLASLGHHVEESSPAVLHDAGMAERFVSVISAYTLLDTRNLEAVLGRSVTSDDLEPDNLFYGGLGARLSAVDYLQVLEGQYQWCREMASWWMPTGDGVGARAGAGAGAGVGGTKTGGGFDVLVTPVLAGPPPRIGELTGKDGVARVRQLLQFTAQFNVTGQPAISLPLHWSADGLPVGVQLVAAYGREDVLVRLAAQLEVAQPWSGRRPPLLT